MSRILITAVYPAPYRTSVFEGLSYTNDVFVIFEKNSGFNRNPNWFSKNFKFNYLFMDKGSDKNLFKKTLRNIHKFDLVLIYDYYTSSSIKTMLQCILNKIPYIINCDGAFIKSKDFKYLLKRFFINRASALFASGNYAKNYFIHYGAQESKIFFHNFSSLMESDLLKNIIHPYLKADLKAKLKIDLRKKIILTIAQFTYRKGIDFLLQAASMLSNKNYLFIVIGGGELKSIYLNYMKKNNISNVLLLDYLNKEELKDYFHISDVFLLPTREDIWGLVINEAMSFGLPVISTNKCIAAIELINHGTNGYIYDVYDVKNMVFYIKLLLENEILLANFGKSNIEKIKEYTVENIVKSHLFVIDKILKKNNNLV